jgi:hypothetical protein
MLPVPVVRVALDPHAYLRQLLALRMQGGRRFLVRGLTPDALMFAALAVPLQQRLPFVLHGADRRADAPCPAELLERVSIDEGHRPGAYDAVFVFATAGLDEVLREFDEAGAGPTLVIPNLPYSGPGIVFVSLPKAASSWMTQALATGLGTGHHHIAVSTFPTNAIDAFALEKVVREGLVTQDHIEASPFNLQALRALAPRFVVNLRDPRPALLSFAHFLAHRHAQGRSPAGLLRVHPAPPVELMTEPIEVQLDWYIEWHLPVWVLWIEAWVQVVETTRELDILMIDYGELVDDEERQLRRILRFMGIPQGRFVMPALERSMAGTTFRRGEPGEWLQVYSEAQRTRAAAKMPAALISRFGWPAR